MRYLRICLFFLLCNCITINIYSQVKPIPTSSTLQTPKEYYLQVKQFGEFVDRFNYKSDWKGNLMSEEFAKKVSRANYLAYLLNADDSRLASKTDSSYTNLCSEFIAFINSAGNPLFISLYSGQVKAQAKVNIVYAGREYFATVEFTPEILEDRSAKWTINKVETTCFAAIGDSLKVHFISPNSHETSFINIKKLNGKSDPIYFFSSKIATDPTLLFMSEVAKNRLSIKNIEKVTYLISFPGWEITVEEFNRVTSNSGWLISDIRNISLEMK
jgi:hypothetical protein